MNRWDIQQNASAVGCEEMRVPVGVPFSDRKGPVVCPKPRRVGFVGSNLTMSLRWQRSITQAEMCDYKGGAELLDMILMKESYGGEQSAREIASSPPFFNGTPPSRVSNPLVQDAQFGDEKLSSPLSTLQLASPSSSSASPSPIRAGCVRMKLGLKPATVRVEGFECLSSRDVQNSSITAVA